MAFVTCASCQTLNDPLLGRCAACAGPLAGSAPGAGMDAPGPAVGLSAPTEAYGMEATSETWHDAERGKGLAIAALCLGGAGLLIFPVFGLAGLILGIVALAKEPAPGVKPLAVTAVVLGAIGVVYGVAMAFMFWRLWT